MRDTDYAFCVARIRANENNMLSSGFIDKLIEADDYIQTVSLLNEVGWIETDGEISDFIKTQNEKLWTLLYESVPDKNELKRLCVLNDFFNIKVAVKCLFTGESADKYFVKPTSLDLYELTKSVNSRNFTVFHENLMGKAAKEAYEIACKTENGQNAEIIIDFAAIDMLLDYAKKYKNSVFSEICAFTADSSNIKTAFRCAHTKKNADFVKSAVSACYGIDRDSLISSALAGVDALQEYLSKTGYSQGAELYLDSPVLYEKWCDDRIIEIAKKSKFKAFGFDPVCAYYYAKINEIKNVRIILSAKQSGVSKELIKERVRASYV